MQPRPPGIIVRLTELRAEGELHVRGQLGVALPEGARQLFAAGEPLQHSDVAVKTEPGETRRFNLPAVLGRTEMSASPMN